MHWPAKRAEPFGLASIFLLHCHPELAEGLHQGKSGKDRNQEEKTLKKIYLIPPFNKLLIAEKQRHLGLF